MARPNFFYLERIHLLIHILRCLPRTYGLTTDLLEEATRSIRRRIEPADRLDVLTEIYIVRQLEERYENGEIGEWIHCDRYSCRCARTNYSWPDKTKAASLILLTEAFGFIIRPQSISALKPSPRENLSLRSRLPWDAAAQIQRPVAQRSSRKHMVPDYNLIINKRMVSVLKVCFHMHILIDFTFWAMWRCSVLPFEFKHDASSVRLTID